MGFVDIPDLPEAARLDPELSAGAGAWVDLYCDYAMAVSPMTPRSFHESAALWLGLRGYCPAAGPAHGLWRNLPKSIYSLAGQYNTLQKIYGSDRGKATGS